ncbi:hypothetical protein BGZ73_001485 [Actinomortierella ambigua]|nr:hypothetical protein BGZ73_001485 [Actinomortierella ambigua]
MAKRGGAPKRKTPKTFDGGGSRVKAANTWDEMEHDAEDDFHDSRGKILLDHEQDLARRYQDDDEGSEEEVFGLDSEEDQDEEGEEELSDLDEDLGRSKGHDEDEDEMDLDKKSWGKGKRSYYDAEEIESDEETAKAEEEEALRLQKKRLQEMSEEDFAPEEEETVWGDRSGRGLLGDKDADRAMMEGFDKELAGIDLTASAASAKQAAGGDNVVVEKITKAHIGKLSKKEILKVLQNQSPELLDLVDEFKEKIEALQAVAEVLQMVSQLEKPLAHDRAPLPFLRLKYQTLANYLTNIAFYITLKSSPGTDALELREHPVIDALVELRTMLAKLDKFENKKSTRRDMEGLLEILELGGEDEDEDEEDGSDDEEAARQLEEARLARKAAKDKKTKTKKAKESKDKSKQQPFEYNVELEDEFVSYNKPTRKSKKTDASTIAKTTKRRTLDDDYGDMDELLDVDLEDKAQKKRSLRDYVAKVDQAVNKRSKILRGSGDTDIPYRDKFKERQEQMKRKAAKQGPEPENTELDDLDWDEKDRAAARMVAGGDEDDGDDLGGKSSGKGRKAGAGDDDDDFDGAAYYEEVVAAKEAKKAARKALGEEFTTSSSFEDTSIDANDKRSISWQILKNKGLTPHRKKEQRNPRVKHRNKYETAKKKIKSVKRVFTRLEGAYGGEKTGIKTGLARSVKFS